MALTFNAIQRGAAFERAQAFPLDKWSYFESYNLAVAAAATAAVAGTDDASNTVYFVGQTLVVNEGTKATLYIIQPDKTLKEVGAVPVGDGRSIEVVNGQIKLKGFGSGYYQYNQKYKPAPVEGEDNRAEDEKDQYIFIEEEFKAGLQPQVVAKASGEGFEIAWYEPNPTTVEGLQSQITALDGSVNNLADKVDAKADASSLTSYQTRAIPSIEGYASDTSTVEGALAEVMSKAMTNAGGITAVEGRVGTAEGSIKEMQSVLNAVSGTYATKSAVDALSTVYETISNVDSKLANYYTSTQADAKFETIANVNSKLENYYTKEEADEKHEEVVEIAQGKTQTFVVDCEDNEFLRLKDAEVNVQQFITIDGKAIAADTLKAGDVILVVQTDVPDRWVKEIGDRGYFVLAALETTKVDLKPYATTSYVDKEISKELLNYISGSISTVDKLVLVAGNNQIKETEYTIINSFTTGNSSTIPTTKAVLDSISNAISDRATKKSVSDEASAREAADNALGERISTEESHRVASDQALGKRIDDEISARETLAERVEDLEAMPFDTYASTSYVDAEISKVAAAATKVEKSDTNGNILVDGEEVVVYNDKALAEKVTNAEASIGENAEVIATIIGEVWGANASAENLAEASSRIDDNAGRIGVIEDKVTNTLATKEYVKEQIQSAEHVIRVKTDDTDFFEITKDQDDIVTINVKDDIENIIASAVTTVVSGGQYVSATISGHGLTIDDSSLVSAIDGLASNPVVSVAVNNENLEVKHHNDDTVSYNLIKAVFGVESIASNAASLVSSVEMVMALETLGHNYEAIKSTVSNAVTNVQTSTLVMSHSGNNLMIDLPSVIWLNGGSASDTYGAEVAENNLFEE